MYLKIIPFLDLSAEIKHILVINKTKFIRNRETLLNYYIGKILF